MIGYQFGDRLIELSQATHNTADSPHPLQKNFAPSDLLPDDLQRAYNWCKFLNPIVRVLYPSKLDEGFGLKYWKRNLLLALTFGIPFFLLLGQEVFLGSAAQ
jgi:hypothetical protein